MSESIETLKNRIAKDQSRLTKLLATRVKRDNEKFRKMTRGQRAAEVAKDVIALIKMGKIEAKSGTYFSSGDLDGVECDPDAQLQGKFECMESCNACAIGSLFVAKILKVNNLTVGESNIDYGSIDDGVMREQLEGIFSEKELAAIENAFEDYDQPWRDKFPSDDERLEAIMKNIVRNKGTFKPEDCR